MRYIKWILIGLLILSASAISAQDIDIPLPDIPGGQAITITYEVRINELPPNVTQVDNQGVISGSNFADVRTDDPNTVPDGDRTITPLSFNLDIRELPATGERPFWYIPVMSSLLAGVIALAYYGVMRRRMGR